ncbi:Protein of unknown function [Pyronema omphalodes CBS 100304]|nr:Protein of unknown function [Pyronema omphalodes CBS 100304]
MYITLTTLLETTSSSDAGNPADPGVTSGFDPVDSDHPTITGPEDLDYEIQSWAKCKKREPSVKQPLDACELD